MDLSGDVTQGVGSRHSSLTVHATSRDKNVFFYLSEKKKSKVDGATLSATNSARQRVKIMSSLLLFLSNVTE